MLFRITEKQMARLARVVAPIALLVAVSGCTAASTITLTGASLVSLIHTDKTLSDHAISFAMKEDCSILHSANNEPYCQEERPPPDTRALIAAQGTRLYCYRTLGEVSCYDRPDYTASGQTRVDFAYNMGPAPRAAPDLAAIPSQAAALPPSPATLAPAVEPAPDTGTY